jgi:hypothetical protein
MRIILPTFALLLAVLSPTISVALQQGTYGDEPPTDFAARDVFLEYDLPQLRDHSTDALKQAIQHTQVLARAERLELNRQAATSVWMRAGDIYRIGMGLVSSPSLEKPTLFKGASASELNALLALPKTRSVRVTATNIRIDVPIKIARAGIDIDLGNAQLVSSNAQAFMLVLVGADGVRLRGGIFSGSSWGILVSGSHNVAISGAKIQNALGGILVTDSRDVLIQESAFHGLREAPILLHGDTHHAVVLRNQISGNLGTSNWHAGIVISDRNADLAAKPRSMMQDDGYSVQEQSITSRLRIPTENLIAFNTINGNLSSGIYSDGGSKNVFAQNSIAGNSKEGFCLDNGSSGNVLIFNVIRANGKRWGASDGELRRDFVSDLGRLPDGSSAAKLPGVSIDNAAYNQILFNNVHDNFGGGIKTVRTAFYNVIGMNTLNENNEGRSEALHFFGIELGAATADVHVTDLDFQPSRGNEIFGNTIRGKHYAGIFFGAGSDENMIFDNAIFGATTWALEAVQPSNNQSFNNLSNLRCRNISTGLDPALIDLGTAH